MMFITIGEYEVELATKLGTARRIEKAFNLPLGQIFQKLEQATTDELIKILAIAADKIGGEQGQEFRRLVEENWDYADLQLAVMELVARLHFTGTPENMEAKLGRFPMDEHSKNVVRELLQLPIPIQKEDGTGEE